MMRLAWVCLVTVAHGANFLPSPKPWLTGVPLGGLNGGSMPDALMLCQAVPSCVGFCWGNEKDAPSSPGKFTMFLHVNEGVAAPDTLTSTLCFQRDAGTPTPLPTPVPTPAPTVSTCSDLYPGNTCRDLHMLGMCTNPATTALLALQCGHTCNLCSNMVLSNERNCEVSSWAEWKECSDACGIGIQKRHRDITVQPSSEGKVCPKIMDVRNCNTHPCPIDCAHTWIPWTTCTGSCGGGFQQRAAMKTAEAQHGGKDCPTMEFRICNTFKCPDPTPAPTPAPSNCEVADWGNYSACSEVCGGGVRERTRAVVVPHFGTGTECPALKHDENCNTKPCPSDCEYEWDSWSWCSKPCGGGVKSRNATVISEALHGGVGCPQQQERVCQTQECPPPTAAPTPQPQDCELSVWQQWQACSDHCGSGVQVRTRYIIVMSNAHGKSCGDMLDERNCNTDPCPVPCNYTDWGACSQSCGTGGRKRTVHEPAPGNCQREEWQVCNTHTCPPPTPYPTPAPVPCGVSDWGNFSTCSEVCGGGVKHRERTIVQPKVSLGDDCPALTETENCNTHECPVNCKHEWGHWSWCSVSCGEGIAYRNSSVVSEAQHGGNDCPEKEERVCRTQKCPDPTPAPTPMPQDCEQSEWQEWGTCSDSCGGGVQMRTRYIIVMNNAAGKPCAPAKELRNCATVACPVPCPYEEWSDCSVTCGGGVQYRSISDRHTTLTVITDGPGLHDECEDKQWQVCGVEIICPPPTPYPTPPPSPAATRPPLDCTVSLWSPRSVCSAPCGGGVNSRYRIIISQGEEGGRPCPDLNEQGNCNTKTCAVDCSHEWLPWTGCDKTCGTGIQEKQLIIHREGSGGGKMCPTKEQRTCATKRCPVEETFWPTPAPTPIRTCTHVSCSMNSNKVRAHMTVFETTAINATTARLGLAKALMLPNSAVNISKPIIHSNAVSFNIKFEVKHEQHADEEIERIKSDQVTSALVKYFNDVDGVGLTSDEIYLSDVMKQKTVNVQHSHHEKHLQHKCGYSHKTNDCECECWDVRKKRAITQAGVVPFSWEAASGSESIWETHEKGHIICSAITFPEEFDPRAGEMQVVATPKYRGLKAFDPLSVWVQGATYQYFKVCVHATDEVWRTYADPEQHKHFIDIQYYAWQSQRNGNETLMRYEYTQPPFKGAHSAKTKLLPNWATPSQKDGLHVHLSHSTAYLFPRIGVYCQNITFDKEMAEIPVVVGVPDYELPHEDGAQCAIDSWIGGITKKQFEICVHLTKPKKAPSDIYYSWLAVEHTHPSRWYKTTDHMPYLVAGRQQSSGWRYNSDGDEEDMWITCMEIRFGRKYVLAPEVLVTANHQMDGKLVAPGQHRQPVVAYVTDITLDKFRVCSRVWGKQPGARDLHWDWIAFPSSGVSKQIPVPTSPFSYHITKQMSESV